MYSSSEFLSDTDRSEERERMSIPHSDSLKWWFSFFLFVCCFLAQEILSLQEIFCGNPRSKTAKSKVLLMQETGQDEGGETEALIVYPLLCSLSFAGPRTKLLTLKLPEVT